MFSKKLEQRPLPMTIAQFNDWSYRIINKAKLPTNDIDTQQFALAGMILQTSPHEFLRPDEYYVNLLKKAAADQCATQVIEDLRKKRAKRNSQNEQKAN